jgi:hypothetical protein
VEVFLKSQLLARAIGKIFASGKLAEAKRENSRGKFASGAVSSDNTIEFGN